MAIDRDTWLGVVRAGDVLDLRDEAAKAGDEKMVAICNDALECDVTAQRECARVIAEAAAQAPAVSVYEDASTGTWGVDDPHGTQIAQGLRDREEAERVGRRWAATQA